MNMRNEAGKVIVSITISWATLTACGCGYYAISGGTSGCVLWNSNEAYLFMEVSDLGFHPTGVRVPRVWFKQHVIGGFAASEPPVNQSAYLLVMRVTSSGVERHTVKLADRLDGGPGSDPYLFTPMEEHVYASCPWMIGTFLQDGHPVGKDVGDGLCKWAGDHFEKATEGERRRLNGISRLTDADLGGENGWSRRSFGARSRSFTISVEGKFQLFVTNIAKGTEKSAVTLDFLRPGEAPQRLGTYEAHEGRISKTEYERTFTERH
jgi:hypothetical protein